MRLCLLSIVTALSTSVLWSQSPAPRQTVEVEINGQKVAIEYGRPALNNRKVSDLLANLPSDRMWRAGSEQITTLTTKTDLLIGGQRVPAGKYSLYVHCPEKGDFALAVNKVLGQPLGKIWQQAPPHLKNEPWPHFAYQKEIADQEVARVPMKAAATERHDNLFTISLQPVGDGAQLTMSWGSQSWSTSLKPAP